MAYRLVEAEKHGFRLGDLQAQRASDREILMVPVLLAWINIHVTSP